MKEIYNEKNSCEKDYSISCVRFISMCLIVVCHIMQRDNYTLKIAGVSMGIAQWFSVGAQMFLIISGYLYGKKDNIDTVLFYKKQFSKILIDYYVFVCIIILIIRASTVWSVERSGKIALLTCTGTVPGLGHLWFVSTILICYLLTPIFHSFIKEIDNEEKDWLFFTKTIVLILIVHIVVKLFFDMWIPAWINCYVIGMIYSRFEKRFNKRYLPLLTILCVLMVGTRLKFDYWSNNELPEMFTDMYGAFCYYVKVVLGMFLVVFVREIYKKFEKVSGKKKHIILSWSDKYSYDVYLVHQIFVLSAFGYVEFIENRWIALPLAVVSIVLCGMLLNKISNLTKLLIEKICKNLKV